MTADGPLLADSSLVAPLVLLSAFLNALWNAVLKWRSPARTAAQDDSDRALATLGWVMGFGGLVTLAAIPFGPMPERTVWPFLAATAALQTGYALFLARPHLQRARLAKEANGPRLSHRVAAVLEPIRADGQRRGGGGAAR